MFDSVGIVLLRSISLRRRVSNTRHTPKVEYILPDKHPHRIQQQQLGGLASGLRPQFFNESHFVL